MVFDVEEFFWKGENSEKAFCADEFSFFNKYFIGERFCKLSCGL